MNLASAPQVKSLLAKHGLHPKKRLGQNFLIDQNTLNRITESSGAAPGVNILEIGPGLGVVTRELAEHGARVVAVETDKSIILALQESLQGLDVEIVISDVLQLHLPDFLQERGEGKWAVVGNLPYYITSPIIAQLIESRSCISQVILMVQREVARRIMASPGTEEYGSLSVLVQFYCDVNSIMKVSRNVFYPIPDVDSELLRLAMLDSPRVQVHDEALFFRIVRAAFGKRRKTLLNALGTSDELGWGKETAFHVLEKAGIDPTRRGETLSINEFASITGASCY